MLGTDRFKFASPNAVDEGEMPPSAPTRTARISSPTLTYDDNYDAPSTPRSAEHTIINTSMNFTDARDNATAFLKDIEVSPTNGSVRYTRERFHDEEVSLLDEDGDHGDQKLGRGYAHSLPLSNSSYNADRETLIQPSLGGKQQGNGWHRPSRRGRRLNIPSFGRQENHGINWFKGQYEPKPTLSKPLLLFLCLAPVVLIVLVSFSISHVFGGDNKIPTSGDGRPYYSDRFYQTVDMLSKKEISDQTELTVWGTPQNKAARWMADVDPLQYKIPPPGMTVEDSYHFVQRYVLVLLYEATGGNETWHTSLDFLSDRHECSWYHSKKFTDGEVYAMGVSCRGTDLQVSDLLIPANNLKGKLPSELTQLSHLSLLSLSHNELTGTIPDLRQLTNLQYVDLGTNNLVGPIPPWINAWSSLKVIGLENNRMTGQLPQELLSLTNLVTLDLKKNLFKGGIDVVNGLENLEYLYLSQNGFAGYLDSHHFLENLKYVQELDLSNNLLYGDSFPQSLLKKQKLKFLDISANALRGSFPEINETNSALEVLEINANAFTGTIPSSIEKLVYLRHLDMQMNHFVGTIPDRFVNLRQLTYLSLGENDFDPSPIPAFLSSFTQLRELSLARCNIVGTIPSWFDVMTNLRFLNLQANDLHGTIPQVVWDLPELSILLLTDNNLNGTLPQSVANAEGFKIMALSENSFTGEVDTLCAAASSIEALSFDCANVSCTSECCNTCCAGIEDSSSCYSQQLMTALGREQYSWEFKYRSDAYSFSPKIIYSVDARNSDPSSP